MKSRELSRGTIAPDPNRHLSIQEKKNLQKRLIEEERALRERVANMINDQIVKEEHVRKAVHEAIQEIQDRNLHWRQLRFHRHKKDGIDYVDVLDRITGECLKTLLLPDYNQLANQFKQHPGIVLDLQG
ncbi:MAG: hypothetical protein A2508_09640 [Candidatus Lambdaproteobacteria bacterium RIFOXYD12_FULL_49_8]|uniref:Uncharacterized protein n=1 Tax=Candidatus Lambdaproteobacteria bacterium RIFOXYD2_FULL_50_16 TaxID=1817772 RepID=A0A1F6GF46_9PROT|nr:MAG: hypothetical protein A2527_04055 [Candidatus Lambdaproteobacteria bacterium RIFOXYD2_FULL_50_16]OGG97999.1 MAG: hypothetical protein A2508_09640 [Candidatus Lambdaproteobacteria bacterium RIFOXYD12_FULL_49_8]